MKMTHNKRKVIVGALFILAIVVGLHLQLPVDGEWIPLVFILASMIVCSIPLCETFFEKRKREKRVLDTITIQKTRNESPTGTTYRGKALRS